MSELLKRKNVLRVQNFLNKFDEKIKLIVLDNSAKTANDAANSLKKAVGSIVKSLLFKNYYNNNEYYLCLISGDKFLSLNKLSKIIGEKTIKANAEECKKNTGFSIGGISPVAHINNPKFIFIDESLNRFNTVYAAAGHHHVVFGIKYTDLIKLSEGAVVDISE